ncbi:Mechanosensitive channel MscK [Ferriphaselus amnicola]|uniref:Mechanosensitive channel MscK n=1 Tax=Ferriphaselus amnicola TaxID=1188319 RepID=A0A2Z6GA38_9PROT|nr:mechanosensitive ion channel domain-containing protein [Ferriphaselus amnicola]BBE50347.1 Mechanosensitive channel MscK [Ferriphaselus amnicola]
MAFFKTLWNDTLGFLREPLFEIGKTDITLLRIVGMAVILMAAWKLSGAVRRSISRMTVDPKNDPGVYLLQRISGYLVWVVGVLLALNFMGFELSSLAFLGGAVGVGLGFGLQNILNNFVSGIIILFEKTIKVGDVVDLQSGVTGVVIEINLRYTRITTSDLMDVLVPNSEFISGRVVNWSFGEAVRRTHIPFSVAYGTDKESVREAGIAAATTLPQTLRGAGRDPDVWLVRLGDSGLDFELVVWIGEDSLGHPKSTQARYLWALETQLRLRGIEVPYPQRDMRIKEGKISVSLVRAG